LVAIGSRKGEVDAFLKMELFFSVKSVVEVG
jgi:hypothetical protein